MTIDGWNLCPDCHRHYKLTHTCDAVRCGMCRVVLGLATSLDEVDLVGLKHRCKK